MPSEFDTADLPEPPRQSSRRQLLRGLGGTASSRLTIQAAQLAAGVVTARLFHPSEFGAIALALAFVGLGSLISDAGLGIALVQKREVTPADRATAFWLAGALSMGLGLLLAASAPLIAGTLDEPRLRYLLPLGAMAFVLNLAAVPLSILERDLRFGEIARVELICGLSGIGIGLAFAVAGAGPYCLLLPAVATAALRTILFFHVSRWRPERRFSSASMRAILGFSGFYSLSGLVYYTRTNTDNVIVGAAAGPTALGFYARGYSLMTIPTLIIPEIASKVVVPSLASARRRGDDFARLFTTAHLLTGVATSAALGVLGLFADPLIRLVYGATWGPSAPILQILCIAGALQAFLSPCAWFYIVTERTRSMFGWSLIATTVTVTGIVIGAAHGPRGVAWSLVTTTAVLLAAYWPVTYRQMGSLRGPENLAPIVVAVAIAITVVTENLVGETTPRLVIQLLVIAGTLTWIATIACRPHNASRRSLT